MDELEMIAFKIISSAGDASAKFLEAIHKTEEGNKEVAEQYMEEGRNSLLDAHKIHQGLLQKEANGEKLNYGILIIHALDHLMNASLLKELSGTIIGLQVKVNELSKGDLK